MIRHFGPLLLLAGHNDVSANPFGSFGRPSRIDVSRGSFEDMLRQVAQDFKGLTGRMQGPLEAGRCAARQMNRCCNGSDWNCQAPGSTCSCDQMCKEFNDCCPDYEDVCIASVSDEDKCDLRDGPLMNNPPTPFEPAQIPEDHRLARASGDPHYHTFDGKTIHYQGGCIYRLTGLCEASRGVKVQNHPLSEFVVYAKNFQRFKEKTNERRPMAWVQTVIVEIPMVNGRKLVILDQENNVKITTEWNDGFTNTVNVDVDSLPMVVEGENGERIGFLYQRSSFIRIQVGTDGLTVGFNGKQNMRIHLPCQYNGNVCGLFGDADNDPTNDNKMANGEIASTENELGESWLALNFPEESGLDATECDTTPNPVIEEVCPPETLREAATKCRLLMDNKGPFLPCHGAVPPADYFEDCVYDLCLFFENSLDHKEAMCEVYENYASECKEADVHGFSWRDDLPECAITCPAGEKYFAELTYEETCSSNAQLAQGEAVEGCFCDSDFVRDDNVESSTFNKCISRDECGSIQNNQLFAPPQPKDDDPNAFNHDEISFIDLNPLACLNEPSRVLDPIKSGFTHHAPSNWIKPDACCDDKPYNSGVEGCCGGKHLYDFNDSSCVGGKVLGRL